MSKLFKNSDLYKSERDYAIGGFKADKELYTLDEILLEIENRIIGIIDDFVNFVQDDYLSERKTGDEIDREFGIKSAIRLFEDRLDEKMGGITIQELADGILQSRCFDSWVTAMYIRSDKMKRAIMYEGIKSNFTGSGDINYENCELSMNETSFDSLLENLQMVLK